MSESGPANDDDGDGATTTTAHGPLDADPSATDAGDDADEFGPEDFADDPDDDRPRTTIRRAGRGGQLIGAAMLGLGEILQPRPKEEIPIEIANPGEPPNIDKNGLDEAFGDQGGRLVGPPLDAIKARARAGRPIKRRR